MQTFYISCEPKNTHSVIQLINSRPGYKFLGPALDGAMVFAVEASSINDAHAGLTRLASVSRSNPLEKKR